jgi:hypothetical protein
VGLSTNWALARFFFRNLPMSREGAVVQHGFCAAGPIVAIGVRPGLRIGHGNCSHWTRLDSLDARARLTTTRQHEDGDRGS